jgi:hypothetical protein
MAGNNQQTGCEQPVTMAIVCRLERQASGWQLYEALLNVFVTSNNRLHLQDSTTIVIGAVRSTDSTVRRVTQCDPAPLLLNIPVDECSLLVCAAQWVRSYPIDAIVPRNCDGFLLEHARMRPTLLK